MADLPENNEAKKLDWMYRDASQIVDREEYLLGRKIDKQLESSLLPPGKDQECLPPSIFSRSTTESQVDIARKLQEDPLYLIKKKEIECREQLLKNPRKMKQLQEMIARQQAAAEKLKRKQIKKRKKKELDALLVKKCKKMFGEGGTKKLAELDGSDSDASSSSSDTDRSMSNKKKKKKKKERKNLDRALALKYKQILGDLDAKGLAEMDSSSESSGEDEKKKKIQRKLERPPSSSRNERLKWDSKKKTKEESDSKRKHSSSEEESKFGNKYRGKKREHGSTRKEQEGKVDNESSRSKRKSRDDKRKQRERRSSSDSSDNSSSKIKSSKLNKEYLDKDKAGAKRYKPHYKSDYSEDNDKEYSGKEQLRERHGKNRHKEKDSHERDGASLNHKILKQSKHSQPDSLKYKVEKEDARPTSSLSERSRQEKNKSVKKGKNKNRKDALDDSSGSDTDEIKSCKISKQDRSKRKKGSSTSSSSESSSSESSSEERRRPPKKQYGLVLPANYVPKKQVKEEIKPATKKEELNRPYRKEDKVKLTVEEKERKLKEMMDNAKWRDEQRDKNIKAFKEKEKLEKDDYVYNEDFMRKQMALAVSQGTVESRVKANINTIQRSGASMSEHFARRK